MYWRLSVILLGFCFLAIAQSLSLDLTTVPTTVTPQSLVLGDFNHDGKPDIAVTGKDGTVAILLGNGDGTFRAGQTISVTAPATRIVKADFNNDGNPDLAVSAGTSGQVVVLLGKADGTFQPPVDSGAITPSGMATYPGSPTFVVGDINGDGKLDLILGPYGSGLYPCNCQSSVSVLLGKGDGTFQPAVVSMIDQVTYSRMVPVDFFHDGKTEVVITDFTQQSLGLLAGGPDGKLSATWLSATAFPQFGFPVTVGDADGNGQDDVLLVLPNGTGTGQFTVYAYLNGSSTATTSTVTIPGVLNNNGALNMQLMAVDLNGDGKLDLLLSDWTGGFYVLLGKGDGTFLSAGAGVFYTGLAANAGVYGQVGIADFRGTGKQDVVVALPGKSVVLLKNGAGTPPGVSAGGVVGSATLTPVPLVAGSLTSIFGSSFSYDTGSGPQYSSANWLFGANVTVNGIAAPFLWVSPTQANVQIPWEAAGLTQATLVFTRNGMAAPPVAVQIAKSAPGLFAMNGEGTGQAAALIANTLSIPAPGPLGPFPASRPVHPGEYVSFFGTGLGPVVEPVPLVTGSPTPGRISQYYIDEGYYYFPTTQTATATVGGVPATVQWSGLAPDLIGVYQINVLIPANASTGPAVPVTLSIGGVSSPAVTIAIGPS
jgi:uncharacterized protein (TIGR03437 family)